MQATYDLYPTEDQRIENVIFFEPTLYWENEGGDRTKCERWQATYHVLPGVSWGSIPDELKSVWRWKGCDILEWEKNVCEKNNNGE